MIGCHSIVWKTTKSIQRLAGHHIADGRQGNSQHSHTSLIRNICTACMEGRGYLHNARAVQTCKERPGNRQDRRRVKALAMICAPDGSEEKQRSCITSHQQCHPPAPTHQSRPFLLQRIAQTIAMDLPLKQVETSSVILRNTREEA